MVNTYEEMSSTEQELVDLLYDVTSEEMRLEEKGISRKDVERILDSKRKKIDGLRAQLNL